jgi:hypothetical protein
MSTSQEDIHATIEAAFAELHDAIRSRDRLRLEAAHDPEFIGAELPGRLITVDEHITTTMNSRDLELENSDLLVRQYGDIALSWGKQTLKGHLEPGDPGTSPEVAADVVAGLKFSFLVVWRFTNGRWRMLSYQVTRIADDA